MQSRQRHKRRARRTIAAVFLSLSGIAILFLIFMLANSDRLFSDDKPNNEKKSEQHEVTLEPTAAMIETPKPSPTPAPPVWTEAVWVAVGDIMMHTPQLPGYYDKASDTYDFTPYFTEVKPILEQGDWVIANLETPVAGKSYGYTGYPSFNAPTELLDALKYAGFNLLSTANNHSLDKGEKGLLRTIEHLKEKELAFKGTASSQEEADEALLMEMNDIRMGFLSYTYGTNGIPIPAGKPYTVELIDEESIIEDMDRLRAAGADFITVALHFGNEYQTQPSEAQKELARKLVAAGADIIAGSHPHVVQPYEIVETTDADGRKKQALIIYSMGNFISNQRGDTKDYGVIFKVNIRKNVTEQTTEIAEVEAIPTWVHRYAVNKKYQYRILPIEKTLADASDPLLTQADYTSLEGTFEQLRNRLQSMK